MTLAPYIVTFHNYMSALEVKNVVMNLVNENVSHDAVAFKDSPEVVIIFPVGKRLHVVPVLKFV